MPEDRKSDPVGILLQDHQVLIDISKAFSSIDKVLAETQILAVREDNLDRIAPTILAIGRLRDMFLKFKDEGDRVIQELKTKSQ